MNVHKASAPGYLLFKIVILLLLATNAAIYAAVGAPGTALDAGAWLVLLLLFEIESLPDGRWRASRSGAAIHVVRAAASAAIVIASLTYLYGKAWLDAINSALWIGVIVLLEFEVRFPLIVARRSSIFFGLAAALYAALGGLVMAWAWEGEWLDAYDALLWLVAFATIEMDVLRFSERSAVAERNISGTPNRS